MQEIINFFFQDFGTSEFASSAEKAREFTEKTIKGAKGVPNEIKEALLIGSKQSYEYATSQTYWTDSDKKQALIYFQEMDRITKFLTEDLEDNSLSNVTELAKESSEDIVDKGSKYTGDTEIIIPTWLKVGAILGLVWLWRK
jgi:hypothetical protein